MRQSTRPVFKGSNPFANKRRDRQDDSINVGTSRNSRRDPKLRNTNPISIPIPTNTTHNALLPKPLRNTRNTRIDRMKQSTESRASQTLSSDDQTISNNTQSTGQVIHSGLSSIRNLFSGKNKRKSSETEVIHISDDEASSSRPGPQKKTRGRLKRHDSEEKIVSLSSLSPPQPILSYPSDLRQRPITNIQEPDVDAMFEKEEDFMNLQNRYQDNLGPLFEPIRQSARLQSDAALSYPTHVKRKSKEEVPIQEPTLSYPSFIDLDPVELVSNKKLRLSYPSSIGLEPKEEASIQDSGLSDRTCIKHEHESHQDSDHRVLIKLDPLEGASDEDVCPTFLIPDPHKLDSIPTNVKPEESKHKIPNTMSKSCSDASQTSAESKEPAQSNSETYISHREYVPLSKSLRQPRSQSDENDVLSCVDNVKASSTGSSSLYTRKIQVGSSSKLETDTYEKGALSDCLQDQDNEEMDLNLPTRSQKRKGKQNQDSSNDKKRKGKAQDNAGTKSETEQVASPIDNPTPIVPYDPIDDYKMEPVGPDEHLLTFPFKKIQKEKGQEKRQEKKNSVIVYEADEKRLDDKTYLNDTLLEVFPKIWAEQFPSASIHTFSSFFFTKLCGEDLDAFKYKDVERWTKDNDIFKKKVLIVPINQSSHWYILLVTNPGYCIQTDKSDEYHESFNSDNGESSSRRKTRKRMINPGTKLNQQKPYIFVLDPLDITRQVAADKLKSYLKREALSKLGVGVSGFVEPEVVKASCPTQKNFTDCGVYCLHYILNFFQNTDTMIATVLENQPNSPGWDAEGTLPIFRVLLRRILKHQMRDYREHLFSSLDAF